MENTDDFSKKILAIMSRINNDFPELSELLNEMPITIPNENHPEIDNSILKDYHESLLKILDTHLKDKKLNQS